jgi:hypothetical protein
MSSARVSGHRHHGKRFVDFSPVDIGRTPVLRTAFHRIDRCRGERSVPARIVAWLTIFAVTVSVPSPDSRSISTSAAAPSLIEDDDAAVMVPSW